MLCISAVLASQDATELSCFIAGSCFFWLPGIWLRTTYQGKSTEGTNKSSLTSDEVGTRSL